MGFNRKEHQSHQRHQNERKGRVPGIATESAMPVVATAQLVVASSRVHLTLLRYISPRYRWASMSSSPPLNDGSSPGLTVALMSFPPVNS